MAASTLRHYGHSNKMKRFFLPILLLVLAGVGASWVAWRGMSVAMASGSADVPSEVVAADDAGAKFVVRFRPGLRGLAGNAIDEPYRKQLHDLLGRPFVASPTASERSYILQLAASVSDSEAAHLLGLLRMNPDVVYAEFAASSQRT